MQIVERPPIRFDQTDYFVLGNLSTDAVAGWEQTAKAGAQLALKLQHEPVVANDETLWKIANMRLALGAIAAERDFLANKYKGPIDVRSFNLSEYLAINRMQQDHSTYFDTLNESLRQLDVMAGKIGYQELQKEHWILNDFSYPLMNIDRRRND
jgi:hypothetical protein